MVLSCGQAFQPEQAASGQSSRASDAFAKTSYYTRGRRQSIKIMSSTEIELSESGSNFVGSYTREGKRIRAVIETLGTKQSLYFLETSEGLQAEKDGTMYYNESSLASVERRDEEEKHNEQARQAAIAAEEERARQAAAAAEARCKVLFDNSKVSTKTTETFQGFYGPITLSDVQVAKENDSVWFGILGEPVPEIHEDHYLYKPSQQIFGVRFPTFWEPQRWLDKHVLASEIGRPPAGVFEAVFATRADAERFSEAAKKARLEWREKWHELLSCR